MLKIVFRTDASIQIGIGHVMRCLTLADAFSKQGAQCTFICRPHNGNMLAMIAERGYSVLALPCLVEKKSYLMSARPAYETWLGVDWQVDAKETTDVLKSERVDWLIVDHYSIDFRWELSLNKHCNNLMVIDDLADRRHACNVLLDQNLGRQATDYDDLLINPKAIKLIGPKYALLRPDFARLRNQSLSRRTRPNLKRILIAMGGIDKDNVTCQVLQALHECHLTSENSITVVIGANAPNAEAVKKYAADMPWPTTVLVDVRDMAQLMVEMDLCIGAAGSSSWERCCLGLPTLQLVLADNQKLTAQELCKSGAVIALNSAKEIPLIFEKCISYGSAEILTNMSQASAAVLDGLGVRRTKRVMLSKEYVV